MNNNRKLSGNAEYFISLSAATLLMRLPYYSGHLHEIRLSINIAPISLMRPSHIAMQGPKQA